MSSITRTRVRIIRKLGICATTLQEKGLLNNYYHSFVANAKTDPTGYKTLQTVLKRQDMAQFKKEWEAYVMKLRF